jgi:hypothetical protein
MLTTIDVDKTIARIERDEQRALELGDLKTAINLNWIRNAVRFDGLNADDAEYQRQVIVLVGHFKNHE